MKPYLEELANVAPYYISAYPNAGLPSSLGSYDETPETMAEHVKPFVEEGLVNILGGCCGTTPDHIREMIRQTRGKQVLLPSFLTECCMKTFFSSIFTTFSMVDVHGESIHYKKRKQIPWITDL